MKDGHEIRQVCDSCTSRFDWNRKRNTSKRRNQSMADVVDLLLLFFFFLSLAALKEISRKTILTQYPYTILWSSIVLPTGFLKSSNMCAKSKTTSVWNWQTRVGGSCNDEKRTRYDTKRRRKAIRGRTHSLLAGFSSFFVDVVVVVVAVVSLSARLPLLAALQPVCHSIISFLFFSTLTSLTKLSYVCVWTHTEIEARFFC